MTAEEDDTGRATLLLDFCVMLEEEDDIGMATLDEDSSEGRVAESPSSPQAVIANIKAKKTNKLKSVSYIPPKNTL